MVKLLNRANEKILNPGSRHFNNRLFKLLLYFNLVNSSIEILLELKFGLKIIMVMIFWMSVVTGIIFGINEQEKVRISSAGLVGIATASPSYRVDIGDGVSDPASGYQFRINASGDYIFALHKQSTPSFSIRNNSTSVVHLNTQNSKRLALGVSAGNASGSIEEHVNILSGGSFVVGSSSYGAAGSFSVAANGSFRQILASGTAQDTLIGAISGVSLSLIHI